MPVAPEEPCNVIAGAGGQARTVCTLAGGAFQDELGVVPNTMASVTAARIFAARMRPKAKNNCGGNFAQICEQKVSEAVPGIC